MCVLKSIAPVGVYFFLRSHLILDQCVLSGKRVCFCLSSILHITHYSPESGPAGAGQDSEDRNRKKKKKTLNTLSYQAAFV